MTSKLKSFWQRAPRYCMVQDRFFERQDDDDVGHAEDSKLIEDDDAGSIKTMQPSRKLLAYQIALAVSILIIVMLLFQLFHSAKIDADGESSLSKTISAQDRLKTVRKALVIASFRTQNVSWLSALAKDWEVYRYLSDNPNPSSAYTVPRDQGREAMVYLTFIIDHYDNLPDFVVFVHGHYRSWHQPEPLPMKISALNFDALARDSYISLRCNTDPGCDENTFIHATYVREGDWRLQGKLMPGFWNTMFPASANYWGMGPPPEKIGAPCCAQFAVSKQAILARPLEFWKMYRMPLTRGMEEYRDSIGKEVNSYSIGLVYEKVWHIVFGKPPVYCPDMDYCLRVQWSDAISCDRYTGDLRSSVEWENITCTRNYG